MRIVIVSGFLGSGKTTFLLSLAPYLVSRHSERPTPLVIIENEIGQISVDDFMLSKEGGFEVKSMTSGCVCCTLVGEMTASINMLAEELDPAFVVIEPTGIADPIAIAKSINGNLGIDPLVITLIDAQRWPKLKKALEPIIPGRLATADLILINKQDMVDEQALADVAADIDAYPHDAPVFRISANGAIDTDILEAICQGGGSDE